jgi:hypothetical protein
MTECIMEQSFQAMIIPTKFYHFDEDFVLKNNQKTTSKIANNAVVK